MSLLDHQSSYSEEEGSAHDEASAPSGPGCDYHTPPWKPLSEPACIHSTDGFLSELRNVQWCCGDLPLPTPVRACQRDTMPLFVSHFDEPIWYSQQGAVLKSNPLDSHCVSCPVKWVIQANCSLGLGFQKSPYPSLHGAAWLTLVAWLPTQQVGVTPTLILDLGNDYKVELSCLLWQLSKTIWKSPTTEPSISWLLMKCPWMFHIWILASSDCIFGIG